jgi:hypothetical protein
MLQVRLVQQAAWDVPVDTIPLAVGYLKAVLDADADLAPAVSSEICNFRGGATLYEMARRLFADGAPDLLAFSVLGWNYRTFGYLAETYKQLRRRPRRRAGPAGLPRVPLGRRDRRR